MPPDFLTPTRKKKDTIFWKKCIRKKIQKTFIANNDNDNNNNDNYNNNNNKKIIRESYLWEANGKHTYLP